MRDRAYKKGIDVVGLLETKVKVQNSADIVKRKFQDWGSINNYDSKWKSLGFMEVACSIDEALGFAAMYYL